MWIDEYVRLAFPTTLDQIDIEKAQLLKYEHMQQSYYRYRSYTDYNLENLKNGIEWFSYPKDFNDPYDATMKVSLSSLKDDIFMDKMLPAILQSLESNGHKIRTEDIEAVRKSNTPIIEFAQRFSQMDPILAKDADSFAKFLDQFFTDYYNDLGNSVRNFYSEGYLVACFSERNDNTLMWSHYAGDHTGYCIEYDFKSLGPDHVRTRMLYPVIYKDEYFDATEYYLSILSGNNKRFNNLYGIYPTISKSTEWAYEREWRMIFPYGPDASSELRLLEMPVPKRIFLGAKINEEHRSQLLQIAKAKGIPVHQMRLAEDRFGLIDEPLV